MVFSPRVCVSTLLFNCAYRIRCLSNFRGFRGLLAMYSKDQHPHAPANHLSILERLTTFPTEISEVNKWWVEELGVRPPKPKSAGQDDDEDDTKDINIDDADEENEDDWRKFFDEQETDENPKAEQKNPLGRLHKLTLHQSLHSLSSHKAVFTRAWLNLLPMLSHGPAEYTKSLMTRALNIMHRGVMPHLTRAVMVMDWVASCVDYGPYFVTSTDSLTNSPTGGTVGLLALNALFILIKEYNL